MGANGFDLLGGGSPASESGAGIEIVGEGEVGAAEEFGVDGEDGEEGAEAEGERDEEASGAVAIGEFFPGDHREDGEADGGGGGPVGFS